MILLPFRMGRFEVKSTTPYAHHRSIGTVGGGEVNTEGYKTNVLKGSSQGLFFHLLEYIQLPLVSIVYVL